MSDQSEQEARLLSATEREAVDQTRELAIATLSRAQLQALAKRLREARDRACTIASQQKREMLGKGQPRGMTPATDNLGTLGKAQVIDQALQRIGRQLRTQREAAAGIIAPAKPKRTASGGPPPERRSLPGGLTSIKAATKAKPGSRPKLRTDPREIGRVSQAGKVAQARRDSKKG